MSEQQLRALIESASDFCEGAMRLHGNVAPIWHMITKDGEEIIELQPSMDKDTAAVLMRALMEIREVVRYVYFTEAWMVVLSRGNPDAKVDELASLSEHPDRVEVVTFQAEDSYNGMLSGHREIIRPKGGKPYLGPLTILPPMESRGRMVGMLPRRGTLQ
jgi:hypothetical protein